MKYQSLRGMKDILPDETPLWQKIELICRNNFELYNYGEIRTPILEQNELFSRAVGGSTDIVAKEMYSFIDRGERMVAMRPEGTAPIVRAWLQHGLIQKDNVTKLYYFGQMFRYERPQAGRYRQFHQAGVEVFGSDDPAVDAETIALSIHIFRDLGIPNLEVDLNSVGCKKCRPAFGNKLKEYLKGNIVKMCEDCQKRFQTNPLRILDCKKHNCQGVINKSPATIDFICADCRGHLEKIMRILKNLSINFKINNRLVRGLDYYSKTTYEIVSDVLGAQNAVCGGGRYNDLVEDFGGPSIPAVGFAIGLERLIDVLKSESPNVRKSEQGISLYIACIGEAAKVKSIQLLQQARSQGIAADMDYLGKKLKSQLKAADRIKADFVIIIGEEELKNEKAVLRDMRSRSQEEIPLNFDKIFEKIK